MPILIICNFDPICITTLGSFSPTPVMLHIKFDQDWPTGFRDIKQVTQEGNNCSPEEQ